MAFELVHQVVFERGVSLPKLRVSPECVAEDELVAAVASSLRVEVEVVGPDVGPTEADEEATAAAVVGSSRSIATRRFCSASKRSRFPVNSRRFLGLTQSRFLRGELEANVVELLAQGGAILHQIDQPPSGS